MGLNFQDSCSLYMSELSVLHDHVMVVMVGVIFLILYMMVYLMFSEKFYKNLSEGTFIETIWSIVPAFLLIVLVLPSMKVLYLMEDVKSPLFTFKVIAHQWYWSYIVPLFKNCSYYFKGELFSGYEFDGILDFNEYPRLLSCEDMLVVPLGVTSRVLVSSSDVIHSFAIPSLGLKVDALPGRVNQLFMNPQRLGIFFGQCSEICGSNHSFMPITLKVVDLEGFDKYSKECLLNMLEDKCLGLEF